MAEARGDRLILALAPVRGRGLSENVRGGHVPNTRPSSARAMCAEHSARIGYDAPGPEGMGYDGL